MKETYSYYEFEVMPENDVWVYVIYDHNDPYIANAILRESSEWFETENEARFAAIGHIGLLEDGEG